MTLRGTAAVVALIALTACGGSSGTRDLATFCEAYHELTGNNPFAVLDVASPLEMEEAFVQLGASAQAMDDAAPDPLRRVASDYREAVQAIVEQLDGAAYDPRNLDTTAYRRATIDYEAATVALSNEARANCESSD